ncbi:MAG: hypothetical protein ACJ77B_09630 [Chloroflexota bacterium]
MTGLDTVLAIGLVFIAAIPIGVAGAWFTSRGPNALAGFFRPGSVAELGWPVGVQEEDAPTWNWDRAAAPATDREVDAEPELVELDENPAVYSEAVRPARVTRA